MMDAAYEVSSKTRAPDERGPWWLPLIGAKRSRYFEGKTVKTWWGEFSWRPCGPALKLTAYDDGASLNIAVGLCQAFIRLPMLDRAMAGHDRCRLDSPRYGFSFSDGALHLAWGQKYRIMSPVWEKRYLFREFMDIDGRWVDADKRLRSYDGEAVDKVAPLTVDLPYAYLLDNGEVQRVTAKVVRERYWVTWVWFGTSGRVKKAPVSDWLRSVQKRLTKPVDLIDIEFDGEVGSRAGSWKGGCTGCGWEMKPGETVSQALLRMQRERRFR